MAGKYELALLVNDVEDDTERAIAISAVKHLIQTKVGVVVSSLSTNSVMIAHGAYQALPFPCKLDTNWDGKKTTTAIYTNRILAEDELQSFAGEMNASYLGVDWNQYTEAEEDYEPRIKAALFAPETVTFKLVIATPSVISTCFKLIGQNPQPVPKLSILTIWPSTSQGQVTFAVETTDKLTEFVNNPSPIGQSIAKIPLTESVYVSEQSYDRVPPREQVIVQSVIQPVEIPDQSRMTLILEKEVKQLCDGFNRELKGVLDASLEQHQPRGADPTDQVVTRVSDALNSLNQRFSGTLDALAVQLRDVEEFKTAQRKEIHELLDEFQTINANQQAIQNLLQQVSGSVQPIVEELKARLRTIENEQETFKKELEDAKKSKRLSSFPLTIQQVQKREDSVLYATIFTRKFYPVYGILAIAQAGTTINEFSVTFTTQQQEYQIANSTQLQKGQYEVSILHFADRSPISNTAEFSVLDEPTQRSYQDTYIYKNVDNLGDLENQLRMDKGEGWVDILHRLAVAWSNEGGDKVADFLQVILDTALGTEEAVRYSLQQCGFQLA